jgi:hypothetical protein
MMDMLKQQLLAQPFTHMELQPLRVLLKELPLPNNYMKRVN